MIHLGEGPLAGPFFLGIGGPKWNPLDLFSALLPVTLPRRSPTTHLRIRMILADPVDGSTRRATRAPK